VTIERIWVRKGVTRRVPSGEEAWERQEIEVEASVEEGELPDRVYDYLSEKIDEWLLTVPVEEVKAVPKLDPAEVEDLPWTSYATKQRAKPGEAGWIFTATKGAEELAKAIQRSKGERLRLGRYEYRFSGDKRRFISRRRVKEGK